MNLLRSVTGIPYIEFDEKTRLIFSGAGETDYGYKYFAFQGRNYVSLKIKEANGFVYGNVYEQASFVTDILLDVIPVDGRQNAYVKDNFPTLRKILAKYADSNGLFPKEKMDLFGAEIASVPVISDAGKKSIVGKKNDREKASESTETMTLSSGLTINVTERVITKEPTEKKTRKQRSDKGKIRKNGKKKVKKVKKEKKATRKPRNDKGKKRGAYKTARFTPKGKIRSIIIKRRKNGK